MPELTFKSAGVSTREIDLSGPGVVAPIGVPAGVVGTANEGPAFVPLTFASYGQYKLTFGASDGLKHGPLAVSEWMKNAQSVTYVRVLGAGDGKKKSSSTGNVTNAGFVVGAKQVQSNGIVAENPYANSGGEPGRTYFLGCFMSQSADSTILSAPGLQSPGPDVGSFIIDALDFAGYTAASPGDTRPCAFTMLVTTAAGGEHDSTQTQIAVDDSGTSPSAMAGANKIGVAAGGGLSDAEIAALVIKAINGETDAKIKYATSGIGASGVQGVTAEAGSTATKITLRNDSPGSAGDMAGVNAVTLSAGHGVVDNRVYSGGVLVSAAPILRGVILAPSGVILTLSGNNVGNNAAPASTATSAVIRGYSTGSVKLTAGAQEFVLLMNGYKGTSANPTHITCSFDMTAPNYFANVLNTKPDQIEEKGHFLYGAYDIYPDMATVTGSGVITAGKEVDGQSQIAFILTSSIDRIGAATADPGSGAVPIYESFEDRFSNAKSPFITSQKFGAAPYDLFRIETLSDGAGVTEKFKISIENINKATSDTDKFGTFDLVLRAFGDSDEEKRVLESYRGLSLDHSSLRYVGRAIGDKKIYYNFDADADSQKIIVEGSHDVKSRFVRVVISDALKNKEVPDEALPMGFRGPSHLLTSGSLLQGGLADAKMINPKTSTENLHRRVSEPGFPYRETIAQGVGLSKSVDTSLYWGMQTNIKKDPTKPNDVSAFDESLKTFVKYFPSHRTDTPGFSEGNNRGVADLSGGTVRDSDRFNLNRFSLEHIKVRTGSSGKADADYWLSASYVRSGIIAADATAKTRALNMDDLDVVANRKFLKFTIPLQGGFDGVNIFDKDKRNLANNAAKREIDDETNQGGTAGPTVAAYRKAIDIMASTSDVDIKLLTIPGLRHSSISDYAIDAVEARFDAMLISDIEERDQFNNVITSSDSTPHVSNTVTAFKNRALDSSFAAAYFPDVTIEDPDTGALVSVPPSVVTLGAYALNDRIGHPWYAPAGFTRGVLNSVETTNVMLNRANLDDLYDADINPLAQYPGRALSIWGQKTLMAAPSALDRVNVRRLLIDVRRKVRNVANTLLFEPNRTETLERFSSLVNPILQSIQDAQGVDRFKVIIDTTTTTQADVENNTLRGKIFLQPTRSVEFVALDFVVTNAGTTV